MRHTRLLLALTLVGLHAACAGSSDPSRPPAPATNRRVIAYAEIQEAIGLNYGNAYQLIQSRRSEWLIPTPTGVRGQVQSPSVWQDRQRIGDVAALRTMPLTALVEIRLLTPSEAQAQLGLNNLGGAIVLMTR